MEYHADKIKESIHEFYTEEMCPPSPQSHIDIEELRPMKTIRKRTRKRRKTLPKYVKYTDLTERDTNKLTPRQLLMVMKKKGLLTETVEEIDKETKDMFSRMGSNKKERPEKNNPGIHKEQKEEKEINLPTEIRIRMKLEEMPPQKPCSYSALGGATGSSSQKMLNRPTLINIKLKEPAETEKHFTPKLLYKSKREVDLPENSLYFSLLLDVQKELTQHICSVRPLLFSISKKLDALVNHKEEHSHMQTREAWHRISLSFRNILQNRENCCKNSK